MEVNVPAFLGNGWVFNCFGVPPQAKLWRQADNIVFHVFALLIKGG